MRKRLSCLTLIAGIALLTAQTSGPKTFGSNEEARDALIQAAASGMDAVRALFGPGSDEILRTGDDVRDRNLLKNFSKLAAEKTQLEADEMDANRTRLLVGAVEWPLAIPLVKKDGRWRWDIQEGKAEIRRRIIGGNELDAIDISRGYVEAQKMYAEKDRNGNGVLEYATRIASTPGKQDGLYWPGEDSPVAAGFAKAAAEGYSHPGSGEGYHGYHYRILMSQGPNAQGGAQDYLVKDLMIGGFALVAWPNEYGVSGIMTFIVNHDGVVYQKDLGARTDSLAKAMKNFNPDKSWTVAPEVSY